MKSTPQIELILNMPKHGQRAHIALLDPEIAVTSPNARIPCILITEEDVTVLIEFPEYEHLKRFLEQLAIQ